MSKQYPIHLFIDLEETVIDDWYNKNFINIDKIKDMIKYLNPDHLHIFSAAVWDLDDVNEFNNKLRDNLEILLKRKIDQVISMEYAKKCSNWVSYDMPIQELLLAIGKFRLFIDFCKHTIRNCFCILLDDMCDNEIIENLDLNLKIQMIRI